MTATDRITLEDVFVDTRGELERMMRRRVPSPDLAADLVQEVYLKCRVANLSFSTRNDARAYLLRMSANLSIDHFRKERRHAQLLGDLTQALDPRESPPSPEAYAIASDAARRMDGALRTLPGLTRQMLLLVRLHGMTHREVAEQLGVSKSLVDKYMIRALLHCRDAIGGLDQGD